MLYIEKDVRACNYFASRQGHKKSKLRQGGDIQNQLT